MVIKALMSLCIPNTAIFFSETEREKRKKGKKDCLPSKPVAIAFFFPDHVEDSGKEFHNFL